MSIYVIAFFSAYFLGAFLLGISAVSSAVLAGRYARFFVYIYLLVLIVFSGSTYGVVSDEEVSTVFGRGTGRTFFGFVNLYLYWMGLTVLFESLWNKRTTPDAGIRKYLLAYVLLFFGHIIVGLYSEVPFFWILSKAGVLHLINMVVFVYVMLRVFRSERHTHELVTFILVCIFATELWGLARYAFLGGDPANYYGNVQKIAIKLTFFDISYSILAAIAAFLAAWRLVDHEADTSIRAKLFYWMVVAASMLTILLSYRRTAWMGLLFMGLLFVWLHRKRIKFLVIVPAALVILLVLGAIWLQRHEVAGRATLVSALFPEMTVGGSLSFESKRLFELKLALETIFENVLLGVGTWGEYAASHDASVAFHGGYFGFMHSGFLHIWLKTGLIGLLLFLAVLLTSARDSLRAQATIQSPRWRSLAATGMGGLLVFLPTLAFGTPIIEYRTMQILGLVLVLPYLALSAAAAHKAS